MSLVVDRGPATLIGSLVVAIIGAVIILYGLRAASGSSSRV
jgi:uncharacterized membrane protein YeaQ/YmgE (transglycosylase-associated protein family)